MDIHAEKIKKSTENLLKKINWLKEKNQSLLFKTEEVLTSTNKEIHIYYIYINCYYENYDYENIQKNVLVFAKKFIYFIF